MNVHGITSIVVVVLSVTTCLTMAGDVPDPSWETIDLWPDGVITYNLPEDMYSASNRGLILSAMRRWEAKTCVQFVPWMPVMEKEYNEKRYINFFSAGSCFSKKGMYKHQPQLIGIGKGCLNMWTVLHELGHVIGRIHEMKRLDRNQYIEIRAENMNTASVRNYDTVDKDELVYNTYGVSYDYKSVMHYGAKAWSSNGEPVMATKDPAYQNVIGSGQDISFFDALYANRAYNCSAKCSPSLSGLCRNDGFLGGPDCRCICHDGYTGQFCDQTLPGFQHIVQWRCQSGWDFHAGRCYRFEKDGTKNFQDAKRFCLTKQSTLVTFKSRPTMEWLSQMTEEKKSIQEMKSYWVGITRQANTSELKWIDGTFVDHNLVAVEDKSEKAEGACAKFDGQTVLLDSCSADETNGLICVKDFDPSCGGRYTVRDSPVTIQSPSYPRSYPENIECTYVLQAADKLSTISITFDMFYMEPDCNKDYAEVKLTNDVTNPGIRYCGRDLYNKSLTTDGNTAVIIFKTNSRITSIGFKATVRLVPGQVKTTPTPLSFLETIQSYFQKSKDALDEKRESGLRKLKVIYDLVMSMAYSNVIQDVYIKSNTTYGNTAVITFKTNSRITSIGFKATFRLVPGQVKTTPTPLSFLETIQSYFQKSKEALDEKRESCLRKLKAIYDLVMSMTYSNVIIKRSGFVQKVPNDRRKHSRITGIGFKATVRLVPGQVKTTPTPLTFLETIQSYFQKSKEVLDEKREFGLRKLKAIYDLVMSMAYSNVM